MASLTGNQAFGEGVKRGKIAAGSHGLFLCAGSDPELLSWFQQAELQNGR